MGRRWWFVGLGGAGVVALVAGLVAWRGGAFDSDDPESVRARPDSGSGQTSSTERPSTTRPATTTTTEPYPAEWDPAVAELARYVEQERGLTFVHPVTVEVLSDAEYEARGEDDSGYGYYDGGRVVVRGPELTPAVEITVVHELTHALQDQHFDIFAIGRPDVSRERQVAYNALIESDAFRVDAAYEQALVDRGVDPSTLGRAPVSSSGGGSGDGESGEDESGEGGAPTVGFDGRGVRQGERSGAGHAADLARPADQPRRPELPYGSEFPSLVEAIDGAAHMTGGQLVEVLLQQGGNAAVDAAFRDPPQTTEQILDPRVYVTHGGPVRVRAPEPRRADGEVDRQASAGALNLYLLLATGIDPLQALDAVTGWGGESAVSYVDEAGRSCMDLAVVGDTEADTAEIGAALTAWSASRVVEEASTTRRRDGAQVLTACGLGAHPVVNDPMQAMLLFQVRGIEARTAMQDLGMGTDAAFAFGDCVVRTMSLDTILGVSVDNGPDEQEWNELEQAAAACQ